ncbi:GntR family transcriptional regulator (plasmid) [Pedobacter sp. BS3]|uniref:GntR family transcriptional regulator n=1 Tax=Pedobacter sp. BS3 TaxID=2567937 RepID=UPI0011EE37E7|nr:GntR family transcriptional regulator [Pedobacter sp. BS3]TZF85626.1 GntR family transcriptional regulator [Pedobacter sp. BS3]
MQKTAAERMPMAKEHSKLLLKTTNRLLDILQELPEVPCGLPSVTTLIKQLNVSRTTVQKLIEILCKKGIARQDGTNKVLLRKPLPSDYFSMEEIDNSKSDIAEKQILKKLSSYELKPGDRFSELELAKKIGSNTVITREALLKIAQSGIIKKHPHQKWEVVELSPSLIDEIAAIRKLYEGYAIQTMQFAAKDDPVWNAFIQLEKRHRTLLKQSRIKLAEMRDIERAFHTTIIKASRNRFLEESYDSVFTLIFFHLWQIEYDKVKIKRVLNQHLAILEALLAKQFNTALKAMEDHLDHAKISMKHVNSLLEKKAG